MTSSKQDEKDTTLKEDLTEKSEGTTNSNDEPADVASSEATDHRCSHPVYPVSGSDFLSPPCRSDHSSLRSGP